MRMRKQRRREEGKREDASFAHAYCETRDAIIKRAKEENDFTVPGCGYMNAMHSGYGWPGGNQWSRRMEMEESVRCRGTHACRGCVMFVRSTAQAGGLNCLEFSSGLLNPCLATIRMADQCEQFLGVLSLRRRRRSCLSDNLMSMRLILHKSQMGGEM